GPRVTLAALARMLTPSTILARATSPNTTSLAAIIRILRIQESLVWTGLLGHDGHDVFFAHDQQFLAVDLDGLARVFAEQHAVADFHFQRTDVAVFLHFAVAHGENLTLVRFLGCCIRNDEAGRSFGFLVETL